jgi:acyl-CoA dehydrogenase
MSEETAALRELIADLATNHPDAPAPGELPDAWANIGELGLNGIGISEEAGGSGGTLAHLAVIADALGEAAIGVPIIEVTTARWVLAQSGAGIDASLPVVVLTDKATPPRVVPRVPWGRSADLLIVYPRCGTPRAYQLDDPTVSITAGVNLAGEQTDFIDLGSAAGRVLIGAPAAGAVRARMGLLWAAALTGAMRGAYQKTREHVRAREQFGAPLIKLPAVASALASFRTQLLLAEAAVARAVEAVDSAYDLADCGSVASARIIASMGATEAARLAHQLHGAMGVTHEAGLHRLTTRLWAWQDAEASERDWAIRLGETAIADGEDLVWSDLTRAF